jgi:hypothetical protein
MNERPLSVIITGLVRDRDRLLRALDAFRSVPQVKQIVLASSDAGKSEESAFLAKLAQQAGVVVVQVPETPNWSGNMLAQMAALHVGLIQVPAGNLVLKSRSDLYLEPRAVRHVLNADRRLSLPANMTRQGAAFEEKVAVWGIEATSPFYIHDLFFLGTKRDVARLVNMDVRYDLLYKLTKEKIHIRRFLHPFLYDYPIFETFLRVENALGVTDQFPGEYRHLVLARMLENETYVAMLALYYRLVAAYFTNDWGADPMFEWREVPAREKFVSSDPLSSMLLQRHHLQAILPEGDVFFRAAATDGFAPCPLGERFKRANAYLDGLTDLRDACLEMDLDAFCDAAIESGRAALTEIRKRHAPG